MARKNAPVVSKGPEFESGWNPLSLIDRTGKHLPSFDFRWEEVSGKRRRIAHPNGAMRDLHARFGQLLFKATGEMDQFDKKRLIELPSSRAFREGDNPMKNAIEHIGSEYFYITDFKDAYKRLDKHALTALFVYIFRYAYYRYELDYHLYHVGRYLPTLSEIELDPSFKMWESFVELAFGGEKGEGIALGGNLSPLVFNMYCEVYLDDRLRYYFQKFDDRRNPEKAFVYTRYADDLVFSRNLPITRSMRREIRRHIEQAGFPISHKKSKVLIRSKGTVFVTKVGLRTLDPIPQSGDEIVVKMSKSVLTFPRKKRRRLQHMIKSFLATTSPQPGKVPGHWNEDPEIITGYIAEFIYYLKNVEEWTGRDRYVMDLCKKFEKEARPYLRRLRRSRRVTMEDRERRREIRSAQFG